MTITYLKNQTGNHHFNVNGATIILWNSGRSLISLDHFEQTFDFNKKMFAEGDIEQMSAFIQSNEAFILQYIKTATAAKELKDTFNEIPVKRFVARDGNDIVISEVDFKRGYVSVTASIISPQKEKDLIKWGKDSLMDYYINEEGLSRREALSKFNDEVRYNGIESVADISLFSESFDYRKTTYYFESIGAGCQHETILALHPELKNIIDLHLKEVNINAIYQLSLLPDSSDYKNEVINHAKNIVKNNLK